MKHYLSGIVVALSLALVLVMGVVALAENGAAELPAAGDLQAQAEAPEAAPSADDNAQATQNDTALQEALEAYRAAKESSHEQALQEELDGYVAAGKLTREQADLIMNYYKERQALRNGTCPGCGYQFQNGKGGRMNGKGGMNGMNGRGGRMNGGFGGKGGRGGFGGMMNGGFDSQTNPGAPNGMSAQGDAQAAPQLAGDEGI